MLRPLHRRPSLLRAALGAAAAYIRRGARARGSVSDELPCVPSPQRARPPGRRLLRPRHAIPPRVHLAAPPAGALPACPPAHLLTPLQSPPPSLREILGAYKSRGDGDRDMLLAMLHAKSAEDNVRRVCVRPHPSCLSFLQRLASSASLYQAMLDVQLGRQRRSQLEHDGPQPHLHPQVEEHAHRSPSPALPTIRIEHPHPRTGSTASPRKKRARTSESSRSPSRSHPSSTSASPSASPALRHPQHYTLHNLPPSPYSDDDHSPSHSHSHSHAQYRSHPHPNSVPRGMPIGSLLSDTSAEQHSFAAAAPAHTRESEPAVDSGRVWLQTAAAPSPYPHASARSKPGGDVAQRQTSTSHARKRRSGGGSVTMPRDHTMS